ncbi:MAG: AraC family transcriptional regulator [Lachnospiraceae bacterium]|nr:AraC family transcriptional regulator [Lachnospiraceae bacterium]
MEQSISIKIPVYEQQDLSVNSFGHSVTAPCHQYGPAVRPYYLIHFILKGKGEYITNNTSYQLAEGQGFLIEPDSQIMYISDREDPWTYIWVGFSGRFAHTLLSSLGLSQEQPIFRSSEKDRLLEYVSNMIRHNHGSIEDTYYIMGMLFLFLSTIASSNRDTLPPSDGNVYINQAITYIQNHITESFQVDDIAHYVGLNRTYLSTLFKTHTGLSPLKYVQAFRLTQARSLLESTSLSVASIACSCGYQSPEALIKLFKQRYQISPAAYRKEVHKRQGSTQQMEHPRQ